MIEIILHSEFIPEEKKFKQKKESVLSFRFLFSLTPYLLLKKNRKEVFWSKCLKLVNDQFSSTLFIFDRNTLFCFFSKRNILNEFERDVFAIEIVGFKQTQVSNCLFEVLSKFVYCYDVNGERSIMNTLSYNKEIIKRILKEYGKNQTFLSLCEYINRNGF